MLKKIITLSLIAAFTIFVTVPSAVAGNQGAQKAARRAEKARLAIRSLGTGDNSRVTVRLMNGRKVQGHIAKIETGTFTVVESNLNSSIDIEYSQVRKVKGHGLSTGAKIGIGAAIAAAVGVIAILANRKPCKNSLCQ